jgi:hypothetical protein
MNISQIDALMNKQSEDDVIGNIFYNLMTNCHETFESAKQIPLPMVWKIIKIMDKENKKMKKEMGRKK